MKKIKIALVKLGHIDKILNIQKIEKWKSYFFKIESISCIENIPETEIKDFFLDQKFTKSQLSSNLICPQNADLVIGIMPYRFIDNFYLHRIDDNKALISLYGIKEILQSEMISLENFILKQFYEIAAIKHLFSDLISDDVYKLVHRNTLGCLFDLNGDRNDIIYNTEKPILCDACKSSIKKRQIEDKIIINLENELKRIKKPLILSIEMFIKKHPLLSVISSGLIAIILNLIASGIFSLILDLSEKN